MKILVTSAWKTVTLDNYEKGQDPSTEQHIDVTGMGRTFDTLEDLASDLCLPENKENWYAFDEGHLICSVMEDDNGVEAIDGELEDFKNGEIDLWAAEYHFKVEFIETHTPSMEELAEKLEIESYD